MIAVEGGGEKCPYSELTLFANGWNTEYIKRKMPKMTVRFWV